MVARSREQLASEEIAIRRDLLVAELKVSLDPKARHVAASHQDWEPEGCQACGQHLCLLSASFCVSSMFSQTCMGGGHTYLQAKCGRVSQVDWPSVSLSSQLPGAVGILIAVTESCDHSGPVSLSRRAVLCPGEQCCEVKTWWRAGAFPAREGRGSS